MAVAHQVTDPIEWNALVEGFPDGTFAQLWEWGEARAQAGWTPVRVVVRRAAGGPTLGAAQLLTRRMTIVGWSVGRGPRAPLGLGSTDRDVDEFLAAITRFAVAKRIGTLAFDPAVAADASVGRALTLPPWRRRPDAEPSVCSVVDLQDKGDLWSGVRRKHREWIRRAEKARVEVTWVDATSPADVARRALEAFHAVFVQIAGRVGITLERPAYYRTLWDLFLASGRGSIVHAVRDGVPLGAMLHFRCGREMTWYAGGQADAGEPFGVSKLLVWRSMLRAQEAGMERYNMWGSMTPGLVRFKAGFGAQEERYIGTRARPVQQPAGLLVDAADVGSRAAARASRLLGIDG